HLQRVVHDALRPTLLAPLHDLVGEAGHQLVVVPGIGLWLPTHERVGSSRHTSSLASMQSIAGPGWPNPAPLSDIVAGRSAHAAPAARLVVPSGACLASDRNLMPHARERGTSPNRDSGAPKTVSKCHV